MRVFRKNATVSQKTCEMDSVLETQVFWQLHCVNLRMSVNRDSDL